MDRTAKDGDDHQVKKNKCFSSLEFQHRDGCGGDCPQCAPETIPTCGACSQNCSTHRDPLWDVCRILEEDYTLYGGQDDRAEDSGWGPDCSYGCKFFISLVNGHVGDWGVCSNPASHRAGLLTWEHQGCRKCVVHCRKCP
jgi:hypothetical protein